MSKLLLATFMRTVTGNMVGENLVEKESKL